MNNWIEIVYEGEITEREAALIRNAAETALREENQSGDVTVMITDEEQIRQLNRDFRNIDRVTDVLTFPSWEGEQVAAVPDGYLGDIAVCFKRAAEQAEEYGHSIDRELAFLTIHGCLHLCGYDHMQPDEEKVMRARQTEILNILGLRR